MVTATDAMPTHWAFYFQGSGLPLFVSGSWLGFICRAHIAVMCVTQTGAHFFSLSGSGGGNLRVYVKGLPAVLEGMGKLVCSTGCTKNAISAH